MRRLPLVGISLLTFLAITPTSAADPAAALPAQPVPRPNSLPVDHPYQKTLRDYLGTLKEREFDHGVNVKMDGTIVVIDPEEQSRHYLLTLMLQPMVGTKRGAPSVQAPPKLFTLFEGLDVLSVRTKFSQHERLMAPMLAVAEASASLPR